MQFQQVNDEYDYQNDSQNDSGCDDPAYFRFPSSDMDRLEHMSVWCTGSRLQWASDALGPAYNELTTNIIIINNEQFMFSPI